MAPRNRTLAFGPRRATAANNVTQVIVVEYAFDDPLEDDARAILDRKLSPCLEVREVRVRTSYLSSDRRRRIAIFDAVDAETVRHAHGSAGVAVAKVWAADQE
jgi:hypothetical protein